MSFRNTEHKLYRFDQFSLDLDRETLHRDNEEIHLRPQAFAVLKVLLEHSGELVTKNQIHRAVWNNRCVTDASIAHCVADVRRALGDRGFELIRTVPRRGYLLDCAVDAELATPVTGQPVWNRRRLFGARRSALVAAVLFSAVVFGFSNGQVRSGGVKQRVAHDDAVINAALKVDQSRTTVAINGDYEKGRFFFKRRADGDLQLAEDRFKAALAVDPEFADAWVGLAAVYIAAIGHGEKSLESTLPLIGDATNHAIKLAPKNAEAHLRRAAFLNLSGDGSLAAEHVETALELEPNNKLAMGWAAGQLYMRGRFDEAIDIQYRALATEPTSPVQYHNLICFLLSAGRIAEAALEAEQYLALKPQAALEADSLLVEVLILQGNHEQALQLALDMTAGPIRDRNLTIIHDALGNTDDSEEALRRLLASENPQDSTIIAEALMLLGKQEEAMYWLSSAIQSAVATPDGSRERWQASISLWSPFLIELRDDDRWQELYANLHSRRPESLLLANVGRDRPENREYHSSYPR